MISAEIRARLELAATLEPLDVHAWTVIQVGRVAATELLRAIAVTEALDALLAGERPTLAMVRAICARTTTETLDLTHRSRV